MAYAVYGYVKDSSGNGVEGVKILPYFNKVDSGSDPSKWSDVVYTTDSSGYYSYSPEDNNLLGSEGVYKKDSDRFYVACSYDGDKDALDITHAMFHAHTIPNADDSEINITLVAKHSPIINSSVLPSTDLLTQHSYTMSENSYIDTSWNSPSYGEPTSQKFIYDLVDIFDGHQLIDTVYTWGEIADRTVTNNTSDSYTFEIAGDYTIKITVREKWDTYTEVTQDVRVKYNEPTMDFYWTPTETSDGKIKGAEEITFNNLVVDVDDRTSTEYTFKWEIEDTNQDGSDNSDTHTAKDSTFSPTKQFQSAGSKTVTLTCYWNDGFDDLEVSISKEIVIEAYTIEPEFTWNNPIDRDTVVTMTDTTVDTDNRVSGIKIYTNDYYDMYNPDSSDYGNSEVDNTESWTGLVLGDAVIHKYQSEAAHEIKLVATYNDGWKDVDQEIIHNLVPTHHELTALIAQDPANPTLKCYGQNEYTWVNASVTVNGDAENRQIDCRWNWQDREEDGSEHLTTREGVLWDANQGFTFQYPSRKPYSAVDGAVDGNFNKDVELVVRYDNGWNDVTHANTAVAAEGSPYEVTDRTITYECNIDGHTHG